MKDFVRTHLLGLCNIDRSPVSKEPSSFHIALHGGVVVGIGGRARKWKGKVALGRGVRVMSCRGDGQCVSCLGELDKGGLGFGSGGRDL